MMYSVLTILKYKITLIRRIIRTLIKLNEKNRMKNKMIVMVGVVSALCLTTPLFAAETAKLIINKNNIKVWTILDPMNPALSYKAETTFNASMEQAVALVLDVENAKKWVPHLAQAEILSRNDQKGEFTLYMVLDLPFPLKDRDLVVKGMIKKDANGIIHILNQSTSIGKAMNPNYIRIKRYEGDWTFQKLAENKVKVTNSGFADPEGVIPVSVSNMFVQQQPYQMLQKMKVELAKPSKKKIALPAVLK